MWSTNSSRRAAAPAPNKPSHSLGRALDSRMPRFYLGPSDHKRVHPDRPTVEQVRREIDVGSPAWESPLSLAT